MFIFLIYGGMFREFGVFFFCLWVGGGAYIEGANWVFLSPGGDLEGASPLMYAHAVVHGVKFHALAHHFSYDSQNSHLM